MSGRGRPRDEGVWKYSYGTKPHVVFAMERRDRSYFYPGILVGSRT